MPHSDSSGRRQRKSRPPFTSHAEVIAHLREQARPNVWDALDSRLALTVTVGNLAIGPSVDYFRSASPAAQDNIQRSESNYLKAVVELSQLPFDFSAFTLALGAFGFASAAARGGRRLIRDKRLDRAYELQRKAMLGGGQVQMVSPQELYKRYRRTNRIMYGAASAIAVAAYAMGTVLTSQGQLAFNYLAGFMLAMVGTASTLGMKSLTDGKLPHDANTPGNGLPSR